MSKTAIELKPIAGFCVKTSSLQPAVYTRKPAPSPKGQNVLEPSSGPIVIPVGFKVFVNIAWDANVPPPPPGSEEVIQRAMKGEDVDENNPDGWYIPVIVSDGREDKDKAGKPSLVFDCIYNKSVKSRTLTDPEFKLFIIELALQRLEAQTSFVLSRQIGTPNIASKGKLAPRTVFIPSFLAPAAAGQPLPSSSTKTATTKPLIQEVTSANISASTSTSTTKPKGILKATSSPAPNLPPVPKSQQRSRPTWTWSKEDSKLKIVITVPSLPRHLIEQATLDIEPRRFMVAIPDCPVLDVNLALSDAEIVATAPTKTSASLHEETASEPNNTLTLKRQRDLDVDGATSEWRVADGTLVITA
ncbi:PIH1 domain-containing protein 1 [Hypsizygus marmoreus]|uniref:PIH1 domain-containing protein 1 n=1 Tax=Hypsizygus marmoreus TaxID=39966 RepID=A0A369JSI1_HYPMA|nr:PIH1 domain-containing protein 1 [Hypsizygus marmoreus]